MPKTPKSPDVREYIEENLPNMDPVGHRAYVARDKLRCLIEGEEKEEKGKVTFSEAKKHWDQIYENYIKDEVTHYTENNDSESEYSNAEDAYGVNQDREPEDLKPSAFKDLQVVDKYFCQQH